MGIVIPTQYEDIVDEIVKFIDLPLEEVKSRAWQEFVQPGWNVVEDAKKFQIAPHQYDEKMEQLYREGDGFIFDGMLFWTTSYRPQWTELALERIKSYLGKHNLESSQIRILMHGGGTGNDAIFLADKGFQIDFFDVPGSKSFDFAVKRFDRYRLLGKYINILTDYNLCLSGQYDVVISFEVLEHLHNPIVAIRDIYSMLKPEGIALITESFKTVSYYFPTHLASNAKYHGLTAFIFLWYGMPLSWRGEHFKPMEFTKQERLSWIGFILNSRQLFNDPGIRAIIKRRIKQMFFR